MVVVMVVMTRKAQNLFNKSKSRFAQHIFAFERAEADHGTSRIPCMPGCMKSLSKTSGKKVYMKNVETRAIPVPKWATWADLGDRAYKASRAYRV